ncbi:unnamed protein product [Amoebophrya sp. A120]|nr:unnamed protein product [Amoebophrya sp. A120]|eukprot:GSA120T00015391001.1
MLQNARARVTRLTYVTFARMTCGRIRHCARHTVDGSA